MLHNRKIRKNTVTVRLPANSTMMRIEKNIIYGEEIEHSISTSLGQLANIILRTYENKPLLIDAETGEELGASLLLNRSVALANWFKRRNIKANDVISVNSENCLEYGVICIAAFFEGITCAPFNHEYTKGELLHVVNLSKPRVIFCSPNGVEKMLALATAHSFVEQIVVFGKTKYDHPLITMLSDIIEGVEEEPVNVDYEPADVNPDEIVATILCSSGTTGLPKGVMATQTNIITYIEIARKMFEEQMETALQGLSIGLTPFFHSFGYMQLILKLLGGNTCVVIRKFSPKLFLDAIVKYQVSVVVVPSPIAVFLTKHPLVNKYDLSCIKEMRCGAAPLGAKQELELSSKLKINIAQGYGLTETTLGVLVVRPNTSKPGSVGQIVPGMMCKVISEQGIALGTKQEGELCFKGPLIMKGYIGDTSSTSATIDSEGWLHTGDVGYYDEEGFFFIVDRLKELIKYKAFQVAPAELEALMLTHPAVADVAVIGIPDEESGELPLAYVVRKQGKAVSAKEIQDFVASNVSSQKKLRGGVQFIEEIPKNPSGKILRRVLRERAKSLPSKL